MDDDIRFMQEAIAEAEKSLENGEIAVGAVAVCGGRVIARAGNERERTQDPTAHAEVLAIRRAALALGRRRLSDVTLYVTLEPCPMCAGAVNAARIGRLVFGAYDSLRGCAGSVYRLTEDPSMEWFCPAEGGAEKEKCARILKDSIGMNAGKRKRE